MKRLTATIGAALLLTVTAAGLAPAANAAEVIAQPAGQIIAQDTTTALRAEASAPRAVTVQTEPGSLVSLKAPKAKKAITKQADKKGSATFKKLRAGVPYTVTTDGDSGVVVPVIAVGPASELTVRTTDIPTSVDLTWDHKATPARGGDAITYQVEALPISKATGEIDPQGAVVTGESTTTSLRLPDLDPDTVYEFHVSAVNALGPGKASIARMSQPLSALVRSSDTPNSSTPASKPASPAPSQPRNRPAPAPAPAPNPGPGTRTIYVCPSGFTEDGGACTKTAAYTFTTRAYTFHDQVETKPYTYHTEVTGPAPIISEFSTENVCPAGYNLEDYGAQGKLCRQYGPAPTQQVKDAAPSGWSDNGSAYERTVTVKDDTPAGFTDNGTEWVKKDAPPTGWDDDGTQYVQTVAKEARTVPA